MIFLFLFIFVTFLSIFWAQIQRAQNILRKLNEIIRQDRVAFDFTILNKVLKDDLGIFSKLISDNAQLYLVYINQDNVVVESLNNNISQYISRRKYKKLHNKLTRKTLSCSYIFSPSIYYRLDDPDQNIILWILNY